MELREPGRWCREGVWRGEQPRGEGSCGVAGKKQLERKEESLRVLP